MEKFIYLFKGKNINLIKGMTVRRLRSTPGMKAMPGGLTGRSVVANISNDCIGEIVDRHEEQHFYWSGSSRVEDVMGFQGVCYCHAQGSCLT